MDITLKPVTGGSVAAIPSKSMAHRYLICAALSSARAKLLCTETGEDINATASCLCSLGAEVSYKDGVFTVDPITIKTNREGASAGPFAELDCGESGSTLRFLLPVAGALGAECEFVMRGRLPQRPITALTECLSAHGYNVEKKEDRLFCSGRLKPGNYTIPGDISSQFASGLLFALPLLERESTLALTGRVESVSYIDMTLDALRLSGADIKAEGQKYEIRPAGRFRMPKEVRVPGDWSNAAFFLVAGAIGQASVSVTGLDPHSLQGDRAIVEVLRSFGVEITEKDGTYTAYPSALKGQEIDASQIPDAVPVLSVAAACARGQSRVYGAARLRLKESDRLKSTAAMISALGGRAEVTSDGLIIEGTGLTGGRADSAGDHRIAMSAACARAACRLPVTVLGAQCAAKSYPGFWRDFERICRQE